MDTCATKRNLQGLLALVTWLVNRQMTPVDLPHHYDDNNYDFIIVGAGSAGCVLANRLSENSSWSVLLLEAGGEEPNITGVPGFGNFFQATDIDWNYKTQPQETSCGGKPCIWTRGKVLGGSSVLNGMIYIRGFPQDYNHWANLGNTGWSYEDVLPYFTKSENNLDKTFSANTKYHSVGGYQSVGLFPYQDENVKVLLEAYEELGFKNTDFNAGSDTGVMITQATQENGERRSSNTAFLSPVRKRPNLKVIAGARVTKILIHPNNKTAYGVEYVVEKNREIKINKYVTKEIIVCGGAINSPQLLMLSGIGPKETLEELGIKVVQDLAVGKNLQDHVGVDAIEYVLKDKCIFHKGQITEDALDYFQYPRGGKWAGTGPLQVTSYITSSYNNYPDIQYYHVPRSIFNNKPIKSGWCYYSYMFNMPAVLRPASRGYITINSTDPFHHPLIYPNTFYSKPDLDVLIEGIKLSLKVSRTKAFKNAGITLSKKPTPECVDKEYGSYDYWKCIAYTRTFTIYHYAGTCKMGPSTDKEAVVDPELRVYGVRGLRVADASVMPCIVSGNTHAPTMMVAEKCSDLIKYSYLS